MGTTNGIPSGPGFRMPRQLREFFRTEQVGGAVLFVGAIVALVWANSPWKASYASLWATDVSLHFGATIVHADLRHVVNEGLMTLFFFVVALEIKRELVTGELRSWRRAALPAIAAVGGMIVPAVLYLLINLGQPGRNGWGVPIATDIAFAVGVFVLLGRRVPSSLKVFLLSLAIVDDIGAILVIALFHTDTIRAGALATAVVLVATIALLRRAGVGWVPVYAIIGAAVWFAMFRSGIHATISGVVLGLMTPARPVAPASVAREWSESLSDDPTPEALQAMTRLAGSTVSVAERLQHILHPTVSCVILPIFGLANAGVEISGAVLDVPGAPSVVTGVVVALVAGKAIGITSFSWMATRAGLGALPEGTTWWHMIGMSLTAGIGFTVSLFIAELALGGSNLEGAAKIGIVAASALASVLGVLVLRLVSRRPVPAA